ncbi:MAG: S-methyl-5-thioribose-1-phosphate isomerase [Acidimicrobiia bacterium]|nr:S-methyl-5-thioribose-1-phosphate isomerase [Acidimicrobiia bacterium]
MYDRTIWWGDDGTSVVVIDQTRLPGSAETVAWRTVDDAAEGIRSMEVRGAPLIGVAAAHGVALALAAAPDELDAACDRLAASRPTAVNLAWAVERCRSELADVAEQDRFARAVDLADRMADEDVAACRAIGEAGVELIDEVHDRTGKTVQIMTHCNAGFLATIEWGTATAPIYVAQERGIPVHVWVSETRPRNQGAALTAWEFGQRGVPHTLVVDNAAGHLLQNGDVDLVITGADRIAANGDTANKIGTYLKALAARESGVPFHIAAPSSTFDAACPDGAAIPIEERSPDEVLVVNEASVAPAGTAARNWGFDVTPAGLITSWITERGVLGVHELGRILCG